MTTKEYERQLAPASGSPPPAVAEALKRLANAFQILADEEIWHDIFGGQLAPLIDLEADLALIATHIQDRSDEGQAEAAPGLSARLHHLLLLPAATRP